MLSSKTRGTAIIRTSDLRKLFFSMLHTITGPQTSMCMSFAKCQQYVHCNEERPIHLCAHYFKFSNVNDIYTLTEKDDESLKLLILFGLHLHLLFYEYIKRCTHFSYIFNKM